MIDTAQCMANLMPINIQEMSTPSRETNQGSHPKPMLNPQKENGPVSLIFATKSLMNL